ncbi:MAG: hypothetical protein AB1801_01595 [Chloroflexota bacterium]
MIVLIRQPASSHQWHKFAKHFGDGSVCLVGVIPVGTPAGKHLYHRVHNAVEGRNSKSEPDLQHLAMAAMMNSTRVGIWLMEWKPKASIW